MELDDNLWPFEFDETPKQEKFTPFSSGTESMSWMGNNCDNCSRAAQFDAELPDEKETIELVECGKECYGKAAIEFFGFLYGEIPIKAAEFIGYNPDWGLNRHCQRYRPHYPWGPPPTPYVPTAPGQLRLFPNDSAF